MLVLSSMPGACSLSCHIALVWSGLPYQVNIVTPQIIHSPEYLEKNPTGQVPLLEDGSWKLTQNVAILSYIATSAPTAKIGADNADAKSQAKLISWLSYISSDYHKAYANIFGASRMGLSKEAESELMQSAVKSLCANHLSKMDAYLASHQFLMDERKTVADAYFWVVTSWAYHFVPTLAADYPNLNAYFERLKQDAGIQRALQEQE